MASDTENAGNINLSDAKKDDVREKISSASDIFEGPTKDLFFLPIPANLRYYPDRPPTFGVWMNIWIGVAASFCRL